MLQEIPRNLYHFLGLPNPTPRKSAEGGGFDEECGWKSWEEGHGEVVNSEDEVVNAIVNFECPEGNIYPETHPDFAYHATLLPYAGRIFEADTENPLGTEFRLLPEIKDPLD